MLVKSVKIDVKYNEVFKRVIVYGIRTYDGTSMSVNISIGTNNDNCNGNMIKIH